MINAVKGFNDILPSEGFLWSFATDEAAALFATYGYEVMKVPVVEKTELFSRSIGQTTDIVEKEMYTFADRRGASLTLRPEGTASVVRAYIERRLFEVPLQKIFYTGPMFRYERPQKGRYRQFYQIGAEVLGDASPRAEAEMLEMLTRYLNRLGLKGVSLQINSLGCSECRPTYRDSLYSYLLEKKEAFCGDCVRRMEFNPLRALDCKVPGCIEATEAAPSIVESLCPECETHFKEVRGALAMLKVASVINPRMVRGLDYYTKTTFEIVAEGLGSQNTVAAGGRYDGLVKELGGPETPCIGFAIGIERLVMLLKETGTVRPAPLVVFITLGTEAEARAVDLIAGLRERGMKVIEDFSTTTLKKRMKKADKLGASFSVIIGEDELGGGVAAVKDMSSAQQEKVPFEALYERLSRGD
ncbi:MAG: histidine--tRNA ligase [Thermodesulfobacteriota bacterium]